MIPHMEFKDVELIYTRAWQKAFQKSKFLLMFSLLSFCGFFGVICHMVALSTSPWLKLVFYFLPVFFLFGTLLGAGIFFARAYYHEVRKEKVSYWSIFSKSLGLMLTISQVSLPSILIYLAIWVAMGFFGLIGQIPYIGPIFSFAPFILVLLTLCLSILFLFALFFMTAQIAFNRLSVESIVGCAVDHLLPHLFSYSILFIVAIFPLALMISLVIVSSSFIIDKEQSLQWLFLMVPIAAVLSPALLFFFNFSVESYNLVRKALA